VCEIDIAEKPNVSRCGSRAMVFSVKCWQHQCHTHCHD